MLFRSMTVTDTGEGIDEEAQDHVFEPFYTTKAAGLGTGLGLSTVYGIVQQSGGWVSIYSEKGTGTTVSVYLPDAAAKKAQRPSLPQPAAVPRGNETILVVEDSPEVRRFVEMALQNLGYTVFTAASGKEAGEMIRTLGERVDLLITDLVLPDARGRELAEALQTARPDLAVLFVSGYAEHVQIADGALPADAEFLQKPFTAHSLGLRVREVLRRRKRHRVLVVDDDPAVLQLSVQILGDAGFDVLAVDNGRDALSAVRGGGIDVLVIDLVMPEPDGIETIGILRKQSPSLPIIAMSGAFGGQFLKVALALGAREVILKPFSIGDLTGALERVLRTS